jgi:carboxyl-terminal processing protease
MLRALRVAMMNRRRSAWSTLALAVALGAGACGGSGAPTAPPTQPTGAISEQARAYLDQVIGLMQANSINRLTIDWNTFRATVFAQTSGAQTAADTYPAIRSALTLLGEGHSSFRTPTGFSISPPTKSCFAADAGPPTLPETIGYVKVTRFSGLGPEATAFANAIQRTIMAADRDDLIGWIVDVRGNGGGNMWPMVAGVGPLLGEGVIGYFIDPTGVESAWEYRNGASWESGVAQQRVDAPYRLRRDRPRVAVLTDGGVASSGEATVIAFRGRPNTRSFGAPTCGLSTAIENYAMTDGAWLNLAISVMADRARTKYGFSVVPDEFVLDSSQAVERAIAWLQTPN